MTVVVRAARETDAQSVALLTSFARSLDEAGRKRLSSFVPRIDP
jgi:hypothetical protein